MKGCHRKYATLSNHKTMVGKKWISGIVLN